MHVCFVMKILVGFFFFFPFSMEKFLSLETTLPMSEILKREQSQEQWTFEYCPKQGQSRDMLFSLPFHCPLAMPAWSGSHPKFYLETWFDSCPPDPASPAAFLGPAVGIPVVTHVDLKMNNLPICSLLFFPFKIISCIIF